MKFEVTHMIADPVTCSYTPERGGKMIVSEVEALSLDAVVLDLTGKGLYQQGHSSCGAFTTVDDPTGGRWDCFKIREAPLTRARREDTAEELRALIRALNRELRAEAVEGNTLECDVIHGHIGDVERVIDLLTPEA
jgi:hypothetical protein